jgi:phosphatidate cytidylyltransferase
MFWQRVVLGFLMILALCGLVLLDGWLSLDASKSDVLGVSLGDQISILRCALPVTLLVILLVVLATFELGRLIETSGNQPVTYWAAFVGAGLVIVPWVQMQQQMGSANTLIQTDLSLTVLWLTGGLLGTCLAVLMRKKTAGAVGSMASSMLLVLYIGLLGSFAVRVRCLSPGPVGAGLLVFYILTVKFGDIGAYFCGKLFGKHKLAPWLSPGKTIEGFVGAVVFAGGISVGLMVLWGLWQGVLGDVPLNITYAIIFGIFMAVVGHLGDLVESAIKRDVGTKDSSSVIPSFGGLLDLLDSPLFAAPFAWLLLTFWGQMG